MWAVFVLLFCIAQSSFVGHVPVVEIDLDDDPSTRWVESLHVVVKLHGWNHTFGPIFRYYDESLFSNLEDSHKMLLANAVEKNFPEQTTELKGLASAFAEIGHAEIDFQYLSLWVWFHELAHTELSKLRPRSCTALLAVQEDEGGKVLHGRNMDNVPKELRNVSIHHVWKQNGEVVFESLTWYWITTGFMTGAKTGLTTLEENWRFEDVSLASVIEYVQKGTLPQVFWFRSILTKVQSAV